MPRFKIQPTDQRVSSAEVTAIDAGSALNVVSQLQCREAEVFQDDAYLFSVRRTGEAGFWTIFQREDDKIIEDAVCLG